MLTFLFSMEMVVLLQIYQGPEPFALETVSLDECSPSLPHMEERNRYLEMENGLLHSSL